MNKLGDRLFSEDAEKLILGAMLSGMDNLNEAMAMVSLECFCVPKHRILFKEIKKLYKEDKEIDAFVVVDRVKGIRMKAGLDEDYIVGLSSASGCSTSIIAYAQVLTEKLILRMLLDTSQFIEQNVYSKNTRPEEIVAGAHGKLLGITKENCHKFGRFIRQALDDTKDGDSFVKGLKKRQDRFNRFGKSALVVTDIPSHFHDLDKLINGFKDSNLMILAGRPGMGKTALGLNFAANVCFKQKVPVAVFSLEMSCNQLIQRLVASGAEVSAEKIARGEVSDAELKMIDDCVKMMREHDFIIDDSGAMRIDGLVARARRLKSVYNIGFLMIDYLQLLSGAKRGGAFENRTQEVSEISRLLKTLARELNIPILCLSQLSRKVEERTNHRPMLSDLRESGSIEQDADVVMSVYRPDYYNERYRPGEAELIVSKNRHGAIGTVDLIYRKELVRFDNMTL